MSKDIKHFWNRLVESRLLTQDDCDHLRGQFESLASVDQSDSSMLVDWLCQQKAISRFQADILDAGLDGPFRFGNYRLVEPVLLNDECWLYAGVHELTRHPVLIEFSAGQFPADLQRWRQARKLVRLLRANPHPNLARCYEAVSIPEYRFIVSEFPRGKRLASLLTHDSGVNWKKATEMVGQIASSVLHTAKHGLPMNTIVAELVWVGGNQVQIAPAFYASLNTEKTDESLIASIGKLWVRLITGSSHDLQHLSPHGVPQSVQEIIRETQEAGTDQGRLLKKIVKLGEKVRSHDGPAKLAPRKTQATYFAWLKRTPETILANDWTAIDPAELPFADRRQQAAEPMAPSVDSSDDTLRPVARKKRSAFVPVIGSIALVLALAAVVVAMTINRPNTTAQRNLERPDNTVVNGVDPGDGDLDLEFGSVATSVQNQPGVSAANAVNPVVDNTIPDDGQTLWESATSGEPVDFTHVPYSPALALHLRWSQWMANTAGQQTVKALGPELNQAIERWESLLGVNQSDLKSVLFTLHTSDEFRYQPFTLVKLMRPYSIEELTAGWQASRIDGDSQDDVFFRGANGICYVLPVDSEPVESFGMGSEQLVKECIELRSVNALSGVMKRLAEWSDRDRHVNLMFQTPGLFNDEGQKLMSGPLMPLNRQLSYLLDRNIRGGLLGVHVETAAYLELRLDSTIDLKPDAAQHHLEQLMQGAIDFVRQQSLTGSPPDYWRKVSDRYALMLQSLWSNFRFGVEDRNLIGNCWLPDVAMHNLVAATELFLSLGYVPATDHVISPRVPATIEELLAMPRDLSIATNPDLIVLLKNLEQEIKDDFATLPFDFEIRLIGADLAKEGITQNQRPSDIEMKQQPFSRILTEIMVKANPDKNITGASDPNCKMVWVLAPDPVDMDRKIIMITTRAAAREKGYELPQDFR